MKVHEVDLCGQHLYLCLNGQALFDLYDKFGTKGFIKASNKYFEPEDVNKIALVAPTASIIEIKDFEVINKQTVTIPESIEHIVKCFNPNCVTNKAHDVPTKFTVIKDAEGNIKLHCHYCEKNTTQDKLEFI